MKGLQSQLSQKKISVFISLIKKIFHTKCLYCRHFIKQSKINFFSYFLKDKRTVTVYPAVQTFNFLHIMYKPSIFCNANMSLQILCFVSFSLNILNRMVPVLGLHRPGKQFELNFFKKKNFL